jgi:large repetitive protein
VFIDNNYDGLLDASDRGFPTAVPITLCRTAGVPCALADIVATTQTDPATGNYAFNNVPPGNYFVIETQPSGYGSTSPNVRPVTVVDRPVTDLNFGEAGASLGGFVYKDVNFDGQRDAADVALPGVTVRLCTTPDCASGSVVATQVTNSQGAYTFTQVATPSAGGSYFIVEDQSTVPPTPTPLFDGTTTVGNLSAGGAGATLVAGTAVQTPSRVEGVSWTVPAAPVTGQAPVVGRDYNFGEIDGQDLSGRVFFDRNRDGIIDPANDTGLPGVLITLCRTADVPCPSTAVVGTTTTAANGDYRFVRIPGGDYFVQESQPPGYGSSVPTPDIRPVSVRGANVTGINFGDTLSSIAGVVYRDNNGDGVRNDPSAEPTMPAGITITLTGVDATGQSITRTTVTDANGAYRFDDLRTGTYTITETQPVGFGTGGANPGVGAGGQGGPNSNVLRNIVLPVNTDATQYNFGDVPRTAAVSGTVWRDVDHDRVLDPNEERLGGWTVQVYRTPAGGGTPTLVATQVTGPDGRYNITQLEPGSGYSVRFIAPSGPVFTGAVNGEQGQTGGSRPSDAQIVNGELANLTLRDGVNTPEQSLPVDPAGVIYDSQTRLPLSGATVRFEPTPGRGCAFDPAIHLQGGAGNQVQSVGADGFYQFLLNPGAPACEYRIVVTPPAGYRPDAAVPPTGAVLTPPNRPPNDVFQVVPNANPPQEGEPTTHYFAFNLNPLSRDVVNNHIPLEPINRAVLMVSKQANKPRVELGDTVRYTIKVRYVQGTAPLTVLRVVDTLPAGFRLIPDTAQVSNVNGTGTVSIPAGSITGAPGPVVTYMLPVPAGGLAVGRELELTYRVRVGVGSLQGDGINRAQALSRGAIRSNVAQARVRVDGGVFANDTCVSGKIYLDCNNNHMQDGEELGVPGVRVYLSDGRFAVSDSEGKYSMCGIAPQSQVLKADPLTLPRGARLTTTSNRNLGNADSLWLDMKNGEMQQADFAIGSCSNTVIEQVKARRAQGGVRSVETEAKGAPALKWQGKAAHAPDQATDSADQLLVRPRPAGGGSSGQAENNLPVPELPAASSNTQRDAPASKK